MSEVFDYIIHTDGSANSGPTGGSACIVEDTNTLQRYYLVSSYKSSTNNQAEIFATLMGYAFLNVLHEDTPWKLRVKVVSDSEHTLSCSTYHILGWMKSGKLYNTNLPLKNRGFWQLFTKLTDKFALIGEHVKGHSGHFDNERCDNAASWARKRRQENPEETDSCFIEIIKKKRKTTTFNDIWFYFDAEDVFTKIRFEDDIKLNEAKYSLMESLSEIFKTDLPVITTETRVLKKAIDKVKEAITMCHKYKDRDERIKDFEEKLHAIIEEYNDEYY
jgi:ribonuclease HI